MTTTSVTADRTIPNGDPRDTDVYVECGRIAAITPAPTTERPTDSAELREHGTPARLLASLHPGRPTW